MVLAFSTTLVSAPRYALMWFPGYLLAARLNRAAALAMAARAAGDGVHPVLFCLALAFSARGWVT